MLVVLTIAGLLVAIARPMYSAAVPGARVRAEAHDLAVSLRDARNRAVTAGRRIDVVFEPAASRYAIGEAEPVTLDGGVRLDAAAPGRALDVSNLAAGRGSWRLSFFADGSSSGGSVAVGNARRAYRLDVDWLTGRIRIAESSGEAS